MPDGQPDLVYFRPDPDGVEVATLTGGELTLVHWSREVAIGKAAELLKLITLGVQKNDR